MNSKKAMMFTTDALIAISLMAIAAAIIFSQDTTRIPYQYTFDQASVISEDSLRILSSIEFSSVNETLKEAIISDTNITTAEYDKNLIYIIGALWAENSATSISYARQLTQTYIGALIPAGYSYGLFIDDNEIYSEPLGEYSTLSASKRMISGIHKGSPIKGTSTRVSISNILSKDTAKFIYFGGFVGEGNITKTFKLPNAIGNVTAVYIEMDAGSNFTISVNENFAGAYIMNTMTPMHANNWTMSPSYYSLFNPCENTIQINFTDVQNSYIGGGYIKISYNTSQMDTTMIDLENGNASERYNFPGINGFINLYSSFYIPGTLNSMRIYLHLDNPYTTYLYLGNTKVYQNQTNLTQHININDTLLSSMLNYASMNEATIPIRLGIKNMTGLGLGSDIVEITDLSGSMSGCDVDSVCQAGICDAFFPCHRERMDVAKDSDKEFVDTVLGNDGQRVGLIAYGTSTDNTRTVYLTENNVTLKTEINLYTPILGGTCISCGVRSAMDMLITTINATLLIDSGELWKYNSSYILSEPPDDASGNVWHDFNYTLNSTWKSGNAILGCNYVGGLPLVTDMCITNCPVYLADLWDDNTLTAAVGFESSLNQTANTFYTPLTLVRNDGWDWSDGIYTTSDDDTGLTRHLDPDNDADGLSYTSAVSGNNEWIQVEIRNNNPANDDSGAWGIQFNITQEIYNLLQSDYAASIYFEWWADDMDRDLEKGAWIKARFGDDTTMTYLGQNLDTGNFYNDATPEIWSSTNNPGAGFEEGGGIGDGVHEIYYEDVTALITGAGWHYLDLGAKGSGDYWVGSEGFVASFDNIMLKIYNASAGYHLTTYPLDLWDDNTTTLEVGFESSLNQTANTFYAPLTSARNDGWDWSDVVYTASDDDTGLTRHLDPDNDADSTSYVSAVSGNNEWIQVEIRNNNPANDDSGSWGIQFNVTQEDYNILQVNGRATIYFDWWADDMDRDLEEGAWIKTRFGDGTTMTYLGENLDTGDTYNDATPEVWSSTNNPGSGFEEGPGIGDGISGTFSQDITSYISSPGWYYLDIGAKGSGDYWVGTEGFVASFDNIILEISNGTETYYFRKNFSIDSMTQFGKAVLTVLSDDRADIYINGIIVDSDPGPPHEAEYWNRDAILDRSYFQTGRNEIAVKLYNSRRSSKFDMRLIQINDSRNKAMLVMSDGDANRCFGACPDGAKQEAIDFACEAYENYGIISHAVGFGSTVDEVTLKGIADCGRGMYRSSNNADELKQIYQDIANAMISYTTQRSNITGTYTTTTLHPDSYIEYNYTPSADINYGEISLTFDSLTFGESSGNPNVENPKNGSYWIPPSVEVIDAKATSYSSEFWTSILNMKNETSGWNNVYNLSIYGNDFTKLGDPYIVSMPISLIGQNQTNYVQINTGTNDTYFTGGSPDNKVIYTIKLKGIASYGGISPKAEGCEWRVEQYNNNNATIKIPSDYNGTKTCEFSSTQIVYDHDDSIDNAAILLLQQLDVTGDNRIDIAIDQTNINIRIIKVTDIPWMWGPAIMKLEIWK